MEKDICVPCLRWRMLKSRCCNTSTLAWGGEVFLLLVVLVWQGSTLNFYLIHHHEGFVAWYFWFLADFLVLATLMAAVYVARRHQKLVEQGERDEEVNLLGHFPLCYISWLFYSFLLVAKVVLLFRLDIAQLLHEDSTTVYSAQFLKAVVAAAALVFLLLFQSHLAALLNSEQRSYLSSVCSSTTFDVLDSVTFLGLLFPRETHLTLTFNLENAVLALSCINFILPGLLLFKLSRCIGQRPQPLVLKLLYRALHLMLVDTPYFSIRCYLWGFLGHDVSIFVIKNVLGIYSGIRSLLPELCLYLRLVGKKRRQRNTCEAMELKEICTRHVVNENNITSPGEAL